MATETRIVARAVELAVQSKGVLESVIHGESAESVVLDVQCAAGLLHRLANHDLSLRTDAIVTSDDQTAFEQALLGGETNLNHEWKTYMIPLQGAVRRRRCSDS